MVSKSDGFNTQIGDKSFFEGKFLVNGAIQINGKFEGSILKVDQITIGENGKVKANLEVSSIVVEGVIIGNIKASTRVMLLPTARVLGDIRTPELIIQNGVVLEGRCLISNEPEKSARDTILSQYQHEK